MSNVVLFFSELMYMVKIDKKYMILRWPWKVEVFEVGHLSLYLETW